MALAAAQPLVIAGLTPTYATPAAVENIVPQSRLFLHVKNTSGSPTTVTINDATLTGAGSIAVSPTVVVIATTGDKMIPLPEAFTNPTSGFIVIGFSSIIAGVSAAVLRLP